MHYLQNALFAPSHAHTHTKMNKQTKNDIVMNNIRKKEFYYLYLPRLMTKLTLKRSCMLVQVNVKICRINDKKKTNIKKCIKSSTIETPCKRTVANMIYDLAELIYGRYLFNLYYVNIKGK